MNQEGERLREREREALPAGAQATDNHEPETQTVTALGRRVWSVA